MALGRHSGRFAIEGRNFLYAQLLGKLEVATDV
jgi:hypothetical protein